MPASYKPHTRDDDQHETTHSQSIETNLSAAEATVGHVLDAKSGELFWIQPQETIAEAVKILRDKRIGALLVKNPQGELVGILSERDVVRAACRHPRRHAAQDRGRSDDLRARDLRARRDAGAGAAPDDRRAVPSPAGA